MKRYLSNNSYYSDLDEQINFKASNFYDDTSIGNCGKLTKLHKFNC